MRDAGLFAFWGNKRRLQVSWRAQVKGCEGVERAHRVCSKTKAVTKPQQPLNGPGKTDVG